jgi:hypothetical protein
MRDYDRFVKCWSDLKNWFVAGRRRLVVRALLVTSTLVCHD